MKRIIQVTQSSMPDFEEYCAEIKCLWDSKWLTNNGTKHKELEDQLLNFLKIDNISLFTNGHNALEAALNIFHRQGEIITTPFTFVSTTQAILRSGLKPVFCDIEPETYTIDALKIEELINENTVAIMPVHVYGNICDYKRIADIGKKHRLKIIYDAAHAFGVEIDGKGIGSLGDISMFSFHATKVFHTIEGGALCYSDPSLNPLFAAWKQFGMFGKEDAELLGTNAKMTEFQAAMGLCNLRHIDDEIEKRKKITEKYRKLLSNIKGIHLCPIPSNVKLNYAYLPITFNKGKFGKSRDEVMDLLAKENIFARKYFYPPTNKLQCCRNYIGAELTPIAHEVSNSVLTLPLYADLTMGDVERICRIITK